MLLRIRRALPPAVLERAGSGDAARVEEALARAAYRDLERLAGEADEARRVAATRRLLGLALDGGESAPGGTRDRPPYSHRPKRGGGFVVEVHEPVEALAAGDAALVYEVLAAQLARVRTRLEQLGHPLGQHAAAGQGASPRDEEGPRRGAAQRSGATSAPLADA
jgi:hypothetical protein